MTIGRTDCGRSNWKQRDFGAGCGWTYAVQWDAVRFRHKYQAQAHYVHAPSIFLSFLLTVLAIPLFLSPSCPFLHLLKRFTHNHFLCQCAYPHESLSFWRDLGFISHVQPSKMFSNLKLWMFLLFITGISLDALGAPMRSGIQSRANVEPFVLPPPHDGPGAMDAI